MNIQALMQQAQAMQKQVEKMLKLPKQSCNQGSARRSRQ